MDKRLLMIPGPIEFDPGVNEIVGQQALSHVAPAFIEEFGSSLDLMRQVWESPNGQPFILAGSGTLAMDSAAANLVEPGDRVLVISTGYFGERYAELLTRYGAIVDVLRTETGNTINPETVEEKIKKGNYRLMTITHVDTSTAVRVDPEPLGRLGKKYGVLSILDGVCSVAAEEIKQEEWGIDVVFTASQKAIGVPPGLALLVVSGEAMNIFKGRKSKVGNYYADWNNWLPVMEAYEARRGSYFGTPAVNLVRGLYNSLRQIADESMPARVERHRKQAEAFREALKALSLKQIPVDNRIAANTLSAPYLPEGIEAAKLLPAIASAGVVLAGGLLPELKNSYFRVGHMGTATGTPEILHTIDAIESGLSECGYRFRRGAGRDKAESMLK